ncbi:hypothetical protein AbraIFM66951_002480 [Aspergillus brasiliensis]|uniref:Probable beta-glucosidase G n=1 Tax=Aspergillus brasiliensis TaxID=319629 RepID=A0A9W5YS66_9EURO|nr:hypothetical protein AbraCBS73388_006737 [Aspergillus brasiliensis]GKZ49774.1 hypothetical protein AbraIFM66951_002480 [Aspergillus brasiliensis]
MILATAAIYLTLLTAVAHSQGTPTNLEPDLFQPREPFSNYSYPSPNATGRGGWDVAISKAKRFVSRLTIEEKVSICTGTGFPPEPYTPDHTCQGNIQSIPRVNFSGLCYSDSDTGIGNAHSYGTGFPPGVTVASTWNRELMRARGFAIAEEFKAKGIHAVLGPVLAFARTVGGGTNFEGFGNDPYLIGVAGYETVTGHQGAGVQAEIKQYIGYDGQQYNRTYYSSNMDSKTFHEVYLWPYAEALRASPACVMTSYAYVNNSYSSQNAYLLNDVLKTHLGFQGYTQTDWFGLKAGVAAVLSGLDQDMPGVAADSGSWSFFGTNYTEGVKNGSIPEWRLTDAAVRIMTPYFWLGQDRGYPQVNLVDDPRLTITDSQRQRHRTLAREIAAAGTVLLHNTSGRKKGLPLGKPTTITLFGPAAGQNPYGPNQYGYGNKLDPETASSLGDFYSGSVDDIGYAEGTLANGGGSASTFYPRLIDPISAIQQRAAEDLTLVDWITTTTNLTYTSSIAQRGTVCIPIVSSFAGEGTDRTLTLLHNGDQMIQTVANNCANTIVIIQSVGPINMESWVEHPNITAILWTNLGGQELGPALVDILYGKVNPSGRLVYTIARNISDYPDQGHIVKEPQPYPQIDYTEGVLVDYRGFESNQKKSPPRFWFGHGLSYSNFTYSNLQIRKQADLDTTLERPIEYVADAPGGDSKLYDVAVVVSFDIRNEGPYDGVEIPQLYLRMPGEAENLNSTMAKVLRGFESVRVRDEETQEVRLFLTRKDISYWSTGEQNWVTPSGGGSRFEVLVGASSSDIRLVGDFVL